MQAKLEFLAPETGLETRPLDLVVPFTSPPLAAQALKAATQLAHGFETAVTLLAIHVLPYPAPLECYQGVRNRLEADLAMVARSSPGPVRVKLVFARDREETFLHLLPEQSMVVIGTKSRWWRTREERFANKLAAGGHSVALVRVK